MVGMRWVGCLVLFALSCGHTARSDKNVANGGAPAAVGGTSSGGVTAGGAAAVAGQAGEVGMPECPVTPATGQWIARGPDPYGFELSSDGSHLSGEGCLGGLRSEGEPLGCSPLAVHAERGRRLAFTWDMKESPQALSYGYAVRMELTLAPDRTAMAGTVWTSLGGLSGPGQDIVLLRYPDGPLPEATICSGGAPSGACFLGPLRSDWVESPRVVELAGGDLLLLWTNRRAIVGRRIAAARFDAATSTWQKAEFLDDGTAPVDASLLAASPNGWAMVAYAQGEALLTRAYDPKLRTWSAEQIVIASDKSYTRRPEALFVYDGGDATLLASQGQDGLSTLSAHDYAAAAGVWQAPQVIGSPDAATYQWAAASDAARNALVLWVQGGVVDKPDELWFSKRSAGGAWAPAARFYTSDKQLLRPAVAFGKNGNAVATWQELRERIAASSYSFQTGAWSEPTTVIEESGLENGAVTFTEAGAPVAYFRLDNAAPEDANQKCELRDNGVWSIRVAVSAAEASGTNYSATAKLDVTPLHPRAGEPPPPVLDLPRCEGYPAGAQ